MSSHADREVFDETLQNYKLNTQLKAKEGWYGFKEDLMSKMKADVEEVYRDMVSVSTPATGHPKKELTRCAG